MENKSQGTDLISVGDDNSQLVNSSSLAMPPSLDGSSDLSLDPAALSKPPPILSTEEDKTNVIVRILKRADVVLVILLVLGLAGLIANTVLGKPSKASQSNISDKYNTQQIPLENFVVTAQGVSFGTSSVVINGSLQLNNSLTLTPTQQPTAPTAGQLYYDKNSNQLAYYNGTEFISIIQQGSVVQSIGGVTGAVTLGTGLGVVGNQLVVTTAAQPGVSSFGGQTGAITLGNGLQMSGSAVSNSGVLSLAAGTPNLIVANDGGGNLTISSVGGGTGTVTSGGGTAGRIAKFTGVQNVEDSLLSESGLTVTANGNLAVTGSLNLSSALTVANGGTGATSLTSNGVLLGQGAGAITAVTGSPGDCLVVNGGGVPAFGACSGGSTVTSLNSLTGALTIADSTGLGSVITINDATTASKGIASFNGTNFSVSSGAVNTIQNINTGASPTFAGLNTNSITPSAALTVGATNQTLTLQGNGGTVLTATNGANTTTISFQAPTANVTYRFATASAGPYDVCTTAGNCAGVGGGVTTGGGTTDRLAKFTAGSVIDDSTITDDGTTVTTTADVTIQGGNATLGIANSQTGTLTLAYGSANLSGTIIQGALATADRTYTLPDADGTFCLSTGNCLGGGSGGANTSLSNLTGVAINTTLLPGAAGAINLGSGTLPFGDLFIAGSSGTPGTNNFRITGASTGGTRTITLPDESGTVCTNAAGSTTCQGNFILNQSASNQTGDFQISGSGRANTSFLTPLLDTPSGTLVLAIGTTNATGGINLNQTTTLAANRNLVMASGTGTFAQTYTGTGTAHTITANALTTGSALNVASSNNSAANTAWSAVLLDVTSAQATTAVSTGTIAGFDVQFTQNTGVAGNVDTVANFSVKRNDAASTDLTVTSILNLANLDTATGNQINVTDGLKINGGANIANGINLSGTFNTNLLTSTSLTITQGGSITTAGDAAINGGDITSSGALNITPGGALIIGVTGQTATIQGSVTTITSNGGTNDIILNSADTIELQDATNITGALGVTGIATLGTLGTADTSTFVCRNAANQLAACLTGGAGASFVQDGNTFAATAVLGTNDNFGLNLEVNNTVIATFSNTGAANFINATNSTQAFNVENSTGGNLVTVDSINSAVGINLGSNNVPTIDDGLEVGGSVKISGSGFHAFVTPDGGSVNTDFSIAVQSPGNFTQVMAMGIDSGSNDTARVLSLFDDRAVAHQPTLLVFNPAEDNGIGFNWNGSSTTAYVQTLDLANGTSAEVVTRSGNITSGNGSSGAVYLQSGSIAGGTGGSSGAVFIQSGNGTGTDSSSGNITLDVGSATGSGTAGTITLGGTNASALTLGRTGLTTTNAGRLAVNGSTTGDALTVTNSTSTGNIAVFKDNTTTVFTISDSGAVSLQNETNQLNALHVQTTVASGSNTVLNVDTLNQRVGVGGAASASKFEVQGGEAAVYNLGANPRIILGDSTTAGQNGFLQWDSTNDYIRLETTGTNGLKLDDNFLAIGNIFPDQPLKIANGSTLLAQVNTTGDALHRTSTDSATAFQVQNAATNSLFTVDTANNKIDLLGNNAGHLDAFTSDADAISIREGAAYANVDGYIYILGGCNSAGAVTSTVQHSRINADGSVNAWATTSAALPNASCRASATSYNGYVYVSGGTGSAATADDVYVGKPGADGVISSWATLTVVMPDDLKDHALLAYNGYLYVFGGQDIANSVVAHSNDVSRARINADGTIGTFTTQTDWIPADRMNFGFSVANGYVYIVGGKASNAGSGQGTLYYGKINADGSLAAASTASAPPFSYRGVQSVVLNGYLYALGGNTSGSSTQSSVYATPLAANGNVGTWVLDSTVLPAVRDTGSTLVANGYVYYIGGFDGTDEQDEVYYSSGPRVRVGASLDLVGLGGEDLAEGGTGGELTAGNTRILGALSVVGNAVFKDGLGVSNNLTVTASNDTAGAFVVMNAAAVPQFTVDTSSARVYIGNPTADATGALLVLDSKNTSGDPTGLEGAMYYNSNLGAFRCYQYDGWRDCTENARTSFHAYTDLMGASGTTTADMHFTPFSTGGAATINEIPGLANHPGLIELQVDADNSQAALQSVGLDNQIVLANGDTWRYESMVRIPTLSDGTQTFIFRAGFLDGEGYAEADTGASNNAGGCYFKYSNAVNGGKWQGTCVNNSATVATCDTASTSGTTVAAGTWYRLTLTVNAAGNSVDFRVNGATTNGSGRCQVTTQIPTTGVGYTNFLMKTNNATAREVEVDYTDVLGQFGAPR